MSVTSKEDQAQRRADRWTSRSAGNPTRSRQNKGAWLTTLCALLVTLVLLFPLYWMFLTSVLPSSVMLSQQPPLIPPLSEVSLGAYVDAFTRKPIFLWFFNSLFVTLGSALFSMVASTLAGYSLSRFRTRGQAAMGYTLLLNRMLPGTLLVIPLFMMFSYAGMTNSLWTLILANTTVIVPFSTWMMKGFFDGIPVELEEAAMIDGCSRLAALRTVVLPLTRPGLAATCIYSAVLAWSDFLFARTLVYDPEKWTITVGTVSFIGEHSVNWDVLMAAGIISVIPMFVLFVFLEPFLVSSMTSGSVKG